MVVRIFKPKAPLPSLPITPQSGSHEAAGLRARWLGFIFELGKAPGLSTVHSYLEVIGAQQGDLLARVQASLRGSGRQLRGQFLLVLEDIESGDRCAFIDHAGMFKACVAGDVLGGDYLGLLRHLGQGVEDFDLIAAIEFLNLGHVGERRTLSRGIETLGLGDLLAWTQDGFSRLEKGLGGLDTPASVAFHEYFEGLALSLRDERVSVDLTGGFDSRLVAALLHDCGLDFEVSLSGRPENADLRLAQDVAQAMNKPLQFHRHAPDGIEDEIPSLFHYLDGHGDLLPYHRIRQWHQAKRDRHVTVGISGAGGENFNDYWWLQDFPFYGRKTSRLGRLYDLRMCPSPMPKHHLSPAAAKAAQELRKRRLDALEFCRRASNTQTYDCTFTLQRMPTLAGRSLTSTTMNCLPVTAPLLDWDLASIAYQLPIRQRLGRRFHRQWMSRLNPQMARCASTNRVSTAWSKEALLLDPPRYAADLSLRFANKMSARLLGRAFLHDSPDHEETRPRVRRSAIATSALERCTEAGVLAEGLDIDSVRSGDLGRILCLGSLLQFLASESKDSLDVV